MPNTDWSEEELTAAVAAYLWMDEQDRSGRAFSKVDVYRDLMNGPLRERSQKAIELRMRNISHVRTEMGEAWVRGFVPAANVGQNVGRVIRGILETLPLDGGDASPTDDPVELESRTRRLLRRSVSRPAGHRNPARASTTSWRFFRDPRVTAWVLQEADGRCELCLLPAPFTTVEGIPYLEVHHVRVLAQGGSDTVENAAALCPNCHRRMHYGADRETALENLYSQVKRLLRE